MFFPFLLFFPFWTMDTSAAMRLQFSNIEVVQGSIYVAVYDGPETFLSEREMRLQKIVPVTASGEMEITLSELPAGYYAVSCFHDVNGNGRIDKNLVGIPTEPYGFSNNARPKFRAPSWKEARFYWAPNEAAVRIRLEKW